MTSLKWILYMLTLMMMTGLGSAARANAAQDVEFVQKRVVILQSTQNYEEAKLTTLTASRKLGIKADLRGLTPNPQSGLSFSKKECDDNGVDYPCYVARGRSDDEIFISIEYSDAYPGFQKGYYIVVLATAASRHETSLKQVLAKASQIYPDVYMKTTEVYMGCMH